MFWRHKWMVWLAALAGSVALVEAQAMQRGEGPRGGPRPGLVLRGGRARSRGVASPAPSVPRAHQNMVDHLMSLPPEQQQQFMRNNPRFQSLPPQQQQNIQRRLEQFNNLPPQKRDALRERYELFRQLPPEQQDQARALYRQWNQEPADRRQEMLRSFRQLRDASPAERQQMMQGDEFRNRFSDREQQTLKGLVNLLPPD